MNDVLKKCEPVDYIFIDGHHDEEASLAYFEEILSFLADSALLIFDDINWSEGMRRVWNAIAHDRCVGVAVSLGPAGLSVVDSSITWHRKFSVPLM